MNAERWQRLEAICHAALELPGDQREAYLASACGDDPHLRTQAGELLREAERNTGFLERPLVDLSEFADGPPAESRESEPLPERIAPYRVVRPLGRGGMGDVVLAVRRTDDLEQQVALKVIRRGMDTDEVLRRFRLERRILATLHHPNIAALLDAGATEDGRPYFVMEYVNGLPLDVHCREHRLGIPARLRLFQTVCAAVQHAHQNLVLHRDLKPRNILVTDEGVPKLLDFGIGKLLAGPDGTGGDRLTRTNVRVLTPDYAAPEQLGGRPVSTATDVYGLGALLYELLTLRRPFDDATDSAAERVPMRPSEAAGGARGAGRVLAGDLDTIVLKALRHEPERRYASAAALADDVQRYLDGLPVSARADTFGYRARKFVRRHRGGVAAAAVVFLALGATTAVTVIQSRRVAREAARVAAERDKALEVRSFLMEMFGASGANRAVGDTVTVRRLLDLQAAGLDAAYGANPALKAEMMEVLADGYDRLGLYQAAEPLARGALEIRRATLAPDDPALAASLNLHGWIQYELGRLADAEPILREAVALRRAGGPPRRAELSRSLNDLGVVLGAQRRHAEADTVLAEALHIRRAVFGDGHRSVGITANNLAASYFFQNKVAEAVSTQDLALRALQQSVGPDHQRTIVARGNLAALRNAEGDWQGAVAEYRRLLEQQTRLQGESHPVTTRVLFSLASVLQAAGARQRDTLLAREAEELFRLAAERFETSLGREHPQLGTALYRLALVQRQLGRGEAAGNARRAVAILGAAHGDTARATVSARRLLDSLTATGSRSARQ